MKKRTRGQGAVFSVGLGVWPSPPTPNPRSRERCTRCPPALPPSPLAPRLPSHTLVGCIAAPCTEAPGPAPCCGRRGLSDKMTLPALWGLWVVWFPAQLQCVGRRAVPRTAGGWPTRAGCSVQGPSPPAQREARVRGRHPLAGPSAGQGARVLEDGEFEKPSKQTKMHKGGKSHHLPCVHPTLPCSGPVLHHPEVPLLRRRDLAPVRADRPVLPAVEWCVWGGGDDAVHVPSFFKKHFGLCRAKKNPHNIRAYSTTANA